ncbi:hypothetical protein TeGR_g11091 [Tetraparma gracilis]|uniref:Glycerol-3-phosphate dehydrogenase NAD-dependent N-terminal domain-containing protein n=1 Tax=Tetraparma gracilis TaxID=2962635 RepID=A0ABQ6N3T0_9STRA|nr:hypothetical protein TeGR_g11091 [Tetraparma gracilis]
MQPFTDDQPSIGISAQSPASLPKEPASIFGSSVVDGDGLHLSAVPMDASLVKAQSLLSKKPSGGPELAAWFNEWVALGAAAPTTPPETPLPVQETLPEPPPDLEYPDEKKAGDSRRGSSFSDTGTHWDNPGEFVNSAARNNHNVVFYCRDEKQAESINVKHVNNKFHSSFTLPDKITATTDLAEALKDTDLIIHALPCQLSPKFFAANKDLIPPNVCICSTAKGLYVETKQLLGDAILSALQRPQPLAFLSGPSFAAEMYVTRSCAELQALCVAMGGDRRTIGGLSGIGDLMLTAFGDLSRNRTCGIRLCKGERLDEILATTTVEGVPTAAVAVYYADACGLECPLFRAVDGILSGRMTPEECKNYLMSRKLGKE